MRFARCRSLGFLVVLSVVPAMANPIGPAEDGRDWTITDSLGRKVLIPARVDRVISLEPEITRIIVALGAGEKLVGIDFFLRNYDHLFPLVFPSGRGLPVVSNQGQDPNFELTLKLRPDILFSSPSEPQSTESIQRKLRTPVAALASLGRFENLLNEIMTVGRIIDREGRARELVDYFQNRIAAASRFLETVPASEKPRVYLSFWGSLLRTPVSYEPVDKAGGVNCALGLLPSHLGTAAAMVQIEQIILWDPDIILVQGNYAPGERQVTVEGVLADPRLASVRAVRGRRVYYTFGFWYWWDPALVLVECLYLARVFYPHQFRTFDLEKEGNDVFKKFYGIEGAFTALSGMLNGHEWIQNR